MTITVDGTAYNVRIKYDTIQREFVLIEGNNAGVMMNQRKERDIVGTGFNYSLDIEPDPSNRADYDALYEVLSSTSPYHQFTLPYGQTTMTFNAAVSSGTDAYRGKSGGLNVWSGLSLKLSYITPQKVP